MNALGTSGKNDNFFFAISRVFVEPVSEIIERTLVHPTIYAVIFRLNKTVLGNLELARQFKSNLS